MTEYEWLTCENSSRMLDCLYLQSETNEVYWQLRSMLAKIPVEPDHQSVLKQSAIFCNLIREVVGNPFRPVVILPCSWNTPDVFYFAVNIIESSDYRDVDVLADLLEEAGCDNEEVLRHLRGEVRCTECGGDEIAIRDGPIFCTVCCNSGWLHKPAPCQPGCWVLRLLTENQPPPDQSVTFRAGEIEG